MGRLLWVLLLLGSLCVAGNSVAECLTVTWTAPGDDREAGTATSYDIRYSTSPISESNWDQAVSVYARPTPKEAGTQQYCVIGDLTPGVRYYVAIKTVDEAGNWSGLSNIASEIVLPETCSGVVGNVDCDPEERVDLSDLTALTGHLFLFQPICCPAEANVSRDTRGLVDVTDLVVLVNHLFITLEPLGSCAVELANN